MSSEFPRDIEGDATAQQQLHTLRACFDAAHVGIIITNNELRCTQINPYAAGLLSLTLNEAHGRHVSSLLPPYGEMIQNAGVALLEGRERAFEEYLASPPGTNAGGMTLRLSPIIDRDAMTGLCLFLEPGPPPSHLQQDLLEKTSEFTRAIDQAESVLDVMRIARREISRLTGWREGVSYVVQYEASPSLTPLEECDTDVFSEAMSAVPDHLRESLAQLAVDTGDVCCGTDAITEGSHGAPADSVSDVIACPVWGSEKVEFVLTFLAAKVVSVDDSSRELIGQLVSPLRKAIARVRDSTRNMETRLLELLDRLQLTVWEYDPATREFRHRSRAGSDVRGVSGRARRMSIDNWRRLIHPDDRERVAKLFGEQLANGSFETVYRIVDPDGTTRWVRDIAVVDRDESEQACRIIGIAADVTAQRRQEEDLANATTHAQQQLSRDLHDSVGQELTGLTMIASQVAGSLLRSKHADSSMASAVVDGLKRSLQQVRRLSHGLGPVDIDADGLAEALEQLADRTRLSAATTCEFRNACDVRLSDGETVNHLYRIAQEAVANSVRHARAKSIVIELREQNDEVSLTITDDGRGLDEQETRPLMEGMGLRIMKLRARLIGAAFAVTCPANGGTRITCRFQRSRS